MISESVDNSFANKHQDVFHPPVETITLYFLVMTAAYSDTIASLQYHCTEFSTQMIVKTYRNTLHLLRISQSTAGLVMKFIIIQLIFLQQYFLLPCNITQYYTILHNITQYYTLLHNIT